METSSFGQTLYFFLHII